jgi:CheY-like chemotaxis protein
MKAADTSCSDDSASAAVRVLIADDNPYFLNAACHFLESCGLQTSRATNGKDALALVHGGETPYDTILIGDSIDDDAGLQLATALRNGGYQGRIVIKSGGLSPERKQAYLSLGVFAMVEIPVNLHRLLKLVQTPRCGHE